MSPTSSVRLQPAEALTIEDLPDEVLEFILGFLPPYKDFDECRLVSKRWQRCVSNVIEIKQRNFMKALLDYEVTWKTITHSAPTITKRYSHAAVVHQNSMFVFGGCTFSMTTFNDLWQLDLSTREWTRPRTLGTFPSPKACSSMVLHKDTLVVYGGWTYPPSYPIHQSWHFFNQLHIYDIPANRWTCINSAVVPPPMAGHSASVHGHWMIVFGGLQKYSNVVHSTKSNDIWKLNLETWSWYKQETIGNVKPIERFGHSQIYLDDENLLIMGGAGGPYLYLNDIWLLNMTGNVWKWSKIEVRNVKDGPLNLWCNPAVRVEDKVVVLSKNRQHPTPPFMYFSRGTWARDNPPERADWARYRIDGADRAVDRDDNVNGRRGTLKGVKRNNDEANMEANRQVYPITVRLQTNSPLGLAAFSDDRVNLVALTNMPNDRLKDKYIMKRDPGSPRDPTPRARLTMFVLDITHALDAEPYVAWVPAKLEGESNEGTQETLAYTLVYGRSELIMFGGIYRESGPFVSCTADLVEQVSNSVHFISAPSFVI